VRTVHKWLKRKIDERLAKMTLEEVRALRGNPEAQNDLQDEILLNYEGGEQ
jgi:hypothetical protein